MPLPRSLPRRLLPFAALACLALLAGPAESRPQTVPAATPLSRMDLPWWKTRFEAVQARIHEGHVGLLLLGDSITQYWEHDGPEPWRDFRPAWEHFYGGRDAVNMGFTGDTTAHLLWRLTHGELDGISPKAAIILIGANNFGRVHWPAEDTLTGIEADVAAVRQRLPNTKILLLSVLPSERSPWVSAQTEAVNRMLAARFGDGREPMVTFLDVTGVFMRDGRLDRDLFLDPKLSPPAPPLHPSAEGQARLAAAVEPTLARLLGDAPRPAMQ
jgi:lysophospholipase L1-like esterase